MGTGEAARRLHVNRRTISRWIRDGLIPGVVVLPSGRHRIPTAVLDNLIKPVQVERGAEKVSA